MEFFKLTLHPHHPHEREAVSYYRSREAAFRAVLALFPSAYREDSSYGKTIYRRKEGPANVALASLHPCKFVD